MNPAHEPRGSLPAELFRRPATVAAMAIAMVTLAACGTGGDAVKRTPVGASDVVVMSVLGLTLEDALEALDGQGLSGAVVATARTCAKPEGTVASQAPAAGTVAAPGDTVELTIAEALDCEESSA